MSSWRLVSDRTTNSADLGSATNVPLPFTRVTSPVRSRSLSACRTTVRLTSKRSQSAASVGIFSPGVSMPEAIARSSSCSSWK